MSINDNYINFRIEEFHDAMAKCDFATAMDIYAEIETKIRSANLDDISKLQKLAISALDESVASLTSRVRFGGVSLEESTEVLEGQRQLYETLKRQPNIDARIGKVATRLAQLSVFMGLQRAYGEVFENIDGSWEALEQQRRLMETSRDLPQVGHFPAMLEGLCALPAILKEPSHYADDMDKLLKTDLKMIENSASDFYEQLCAQLGAELTEARMRFDAAKLDNDIEGMRLAKAYWQQIEGCLQDAADQLKRGRASLHTANILEKNRLSGLIEFAHKQVKAIEQTLLYPGRSLEEAEEEISKTSGLPQANPPADVRQRFLAAPPQSSGLKSRLALHQRNLAPVPETSETLKRWISAGFLGLAALSGIRGTAELLEQGKWIEQTGYILKEAKEVLAIKTDKLRSEAKKLVEEADKLGLSTRIEVPDVKKSLTDLDMLPTVVADIARAEGEVEALKERFVASEYLDEQLVQLKSFLEIKSALPIDNRLFQHLVLPFSGKGTGFEGNSARGMLDYNLMLAEQWVETMEKNPLRSPIVEDLELKAFQKLRDSLRTAAHMTRLMRGDLPTFHQGVRAQLDGMQKGDSFFLHTGWVTPAGSHSVVVEFIHEGETYAVRVYNQGDGLEKHAHTESGSPAYLTFLEWENVDPEMIATPTFLGMLAALDRGEYGDRVGPTELYDVIMPMLEGRHSTRAYSDDNTQRSLSVGHCTQTSLEAVYHQHLRHTGRFDRFVMLTRVKALQGMVPLIPNAESRELVRMGLQQVAHDVIGASTMVFSDGERVYIQGLFDHVRASIDAADKADGKMVTRPTVDLNVPAKVLGRDIDVYVTNALAPPGVWGERSKRYDLPVNRLILAIRGYTPSPATIAEHVDSVFAGIDKYNAVADSKVLLTELIDRLPLELPADPAAPIPFWSEMSPADASRLLDILVQENWLYTRAIVASGSGAMSSVDTLAMLKVFTLADVLVQQLPVEDRVMLDHLLQPSLRLFLTNQMPNSELTSSSWQRQFVQLQNYWLERRRDEDPSGPSFFFTEGFAPGMYLQGQGIVYGAEPSYDEGDWEPWHNQVRGDKLTTPWRAFEWVKQWVKSNPNRVKEAFSGAPVMNDRRKTCLLLTDQSNRFLPKGFSALQDLSADLGILTRGSEDENIHKQPDDLLTLDDGRPILHVVDAPADQYGLTPPRLVFEYETTWRAPHIKDAKIDRMPSSLSRIQMGSLPKVNENRNALYLESIGSQLMGKLRKRTPPTERALYREEIAKLDIPAQLARRLEGCSSVKSLQIAETLALFNENRELLDRPDTSQLMGKLLLEPGLLEHHLCSSPAAAEATLTTLSTMFDEHYRLKDALGEVESAAGVLQLYDLVARIASDIIAREPNLPRIEFLDARAQWRRLLKQDLTPDQRSRYAADLAMSYAEATALGPEALEDILTSLMLFDMHPLRPNNPLWSNEQQERFSNLPKSLAGLLHKGLPDEDTHMLSRAIGRVLPGFTERPFTRNAYLSHIFTDATGDVEVNLLSGHVWMRQGLPRMLPHEVLSDAPIRSLAALHGLLWIEGAPGHFRCSTPQGELFILGDDHNRIKEVHWKRGEDLLLYTPWNGVASQEIDFLRESGSLWRDTDGKTAWVTAKENLTPLYRLDFWGNRIQAVHELDESGADTGRVLGRTPTAFALLDATDDKDEDITSKYIRTWVNGKSGLIENITMLRLGLEFNVHTVNGERRAYCPRFPGWYVPVGRNHVEALGKVKNSMLLYKDRQGGTVEKQVIIPGQLLQTGYWPLIPHLTPDASGDLTARTPVYRYGIDEENGKLLPLTAAAGALHLASYTLHQRDYSRAIELMHGPGIGIGKLDREQRNLIITLTKMPVTTKNHSPPSLAATMEAHYLLIRDAWHFGTRTQVGDIDIANPWERKWSQVQFAKDFQAYLKVADQMGIYALSPDKMSLLAAYADQLKEPVNFNQNNKDEALYYGELESAANKIGKVLSARAKDAHHSGGGWYRTTWVRPEDEYSGLEYNFHDVEEFSRDYLKKHEYIVQCKRRMDLADVEIEGETVLDLPLQQKEDKFLEWVYIDADFFNLYLKVRYPTPERLRELVVYLTGTEPLHDARAEAITALRAHRLSTNNVHQRVLWTLILSVLLEPNKWPASGREYIGKTMYPWELELSYQSPKDEGEGEEQKIDRAKVPQPLLAKQSQPTRFADAGFQLCTRLKPDVMELRQPMITNFEGAIEMRPMKQADRASRDLGLKRLEAIFDVTTQDPYLKGALGSAAEEVQAFRTTLEDDTLYAVKDGAEQTLETWSEELKNIAEHLQYDLEQAQHWVVELANQEPKDPLLRARLRQELEGKTLAPIDFNEVTTFLLTRDMEELHRRLPQLSPDEVHRLYDMTVEALKIGRLQRMAAFQKLLVDTLHAAVKRGEPAVEISRIGKILEAAHQYHPSYASDEIPEYLVYDYFMSKGDPAFRLREDQVAVLEKLPETQFHAHTDHLTGVLLEAIMGFGKTAVVSVLQAIQAADGEKVVAVSMPEVLLPSMSATLERLLGTGFGRAVEVVSFGRDSDVSAPALRHLLERLELIRTERRVMLISSGSVLSIALRFAEMCLSGNHITDEQLELMGKVVDTLRTSGAANLDEVDLLLDVLRAHLFTLGDKERMHKDLETASLSLFGLIATDPSLRELIRWPFIENGSTIPFSEENYEQHAKQKLIDAVVTGKVSPEDRPMQSFLAGLDETGRAHVRSYLNAKPPRPEALITLFSRLKPAERKALAAYIVDGQGPEPSLSAQEKDAVEDYRRGRTDPSYAFVEKIDNPHIKNLLATYKEQISSLFPLVLNKILGENFGAMPSKWRAEQPDMDFVAIPYHGSDNPAKKALHGTVTEILDYTIVMHLAQPISHEIIDKETAALKEALDKEKEGFVGSIDDLKSYQTFYHLNGNDHSYKLKATLAPADREKMAKHINEHPELKLELIQRHALPQVKRYAKQLGLSAQMVAYLFKTVKAYSGTVWNRETFPQMFHKFIPSDTQPRTLALLWENSPHTIRTLPEAPKGAAIGERITGLYEGFQGSFADLAGVFRDDSNYEVAKAIISQPQFEATRYKAIMFHNEEGREMVLRRHTETPVPLSMAGMDRDDVAGYWAQKYCTGVDWKLHPLEEAIVSVGRQTLMRDGLQAVWRLRGLAAGQKVRFVVSEEDKRVIAATLKRVFDIDVGDELKLEHFFVYAVTLEKERLRTDIPRALSESLRAHLIDKVFGAISGAKGPELRTLFQATAKLFVVEEPSSPWEQMGKTATEAPAEIVVRENIKQLIDSEPFQAFSTHPLLTAKYSVETLKGELYAIADTFYDKMPPTLQTPIGSRNNREVQLETETQKMTETNRKQEQQQQKEIQTEIQSPLYTERRPILELPQDRLLEAKTWQPVAIDTVTGETSPQNQMLRLSEIASPLFDSELLIDLNLAPMYERTSDKQAPYSPWNAYQDYASNVVVIDDGRAVRLALVSQDTAEQLQDHLPKQASGDVKVALVNLGSGVVTQGPQPVDLAALQHDEKYVRLTVQAKFFDGRVHYSKDELPRLEKWIRQHGFEPMQQLFERKILSNKGYSQQQYEVSSLRKLFARLEAEEQNKEF